MKCEAQAMARAEFGDDEIPACHEEATVVVVGWNLCAGCEDALKRIIDFSTLVIRRLDERN